MSIYLDSVELPDDLFWIDEFGWEPVGQEQTYTLSGSVLVDENELTEGRPITLSSSDSSWTTRATVIELKALAYEVGKTMTLSYNDTEYSVVFNRINGNGVVATQVDPVANPDDDDYYNVTIYLMEKS